MEFWNVKIVILDEADRMLNLGFKTQIEGIIEDFSMPKPVCDRLRVSYCNVLSNNLF